MSRERMSSQVELSSLIRGRFPVVYVLSSEEERVEAALLETARRLDMVLLVWSATDGFCARYGRLEGGIGSDIVDPLDALDFIKNSQRRAIYVLRDLHAFFDDRYVIRKLRDLCRVLRTKQATAVLLSPVMIIPQELEKEVSIIDWELPDRHELDLAVQRLTAHLPNGCEAGIAAMPEGREQIVDATLGLTLAEAENAIAKSVVHHKTFHLPTILSEKKHIIRKSGILEYYEAEENLDVIGGLDMLKSWLRRRRHAFTIKAREFGLPLPKGILLMGVPGCGKSLTAKAVGAAWQLPLLRLDVGKVFGGVVGASEGNIRKAIRTAEAIAPSILWIDELEKGFSNSFSVSDGGTAARVFGTFLTWMQEKTTPVFVIATANSVLGIPPELLRKGRFDEIFFVDLPNSGERAEILKIHLAKKRRLSEAQDLRRLQEAMPEFSGSEIEQVIISAMYEAFDHDPSIHELTTDQLLRAASEIVPLAVTMNEHIIRLREWAQTRARAASASGYRVLSSSSAST